MLEDSVSMYMCIAHDCAHCGNPFITNRHCIFIYKSFIISPLLSLHSHIPSPTPSPHPLPHSLSTPSPHTQMSVSVVVLMSALLVVCATLPLVPSYISHHLSDLFEIFTQLATIRSSSRLGE